MTEAEKLVRIMRSSFTDDVFEMAVRMRENFPTVAHTASDLCGLIGELFDHLEPAAVREYLDAAYAVCLRLSINVEKAMENDDAS